MFDNYLVRGGAVMINWIVVVVVVVVNMVLGMLWYGPLFGGLWLRFIGKTKDEIGNSNNPLMYAVPVIGAAVSATFLGYLISVLLVDVWWHGTLWGLALWLAFGGSGLLTTSVFEERKPQVALLFIAYQCVVYATAGTLFAVW